MLGACLGLSTALATACDAAYLASLPLTGSYAALALLLQLHLRCLGASWGLLRGNVKCVSYCGLNAHPCPARQLKHLSARCYP